MKTNKQIRRYFNTMTEEAKTDVLVKILSFYNETDGDIVANEYLEAISENIDEYTKMYPEGY